MMPTGSRITPILDPKVPSAVRHAATVFLCKHVDIRAISTSEAVDSVRADVPDCRLSDEAIERYVAMTAIEQGYVILFDRRGRRHSQWRPVALFGG